MRKQARLQLLKYGSYTLLLLLLYVLQTTPKLLVLWNTKPMPVVAAALAIALFEGETIGAFYGAFAGLLCDMSGATLFGYNGFMLALACIVAGLLVEYLMRPTLFTYLVCTLLVMLVVYSISFVFIYGMWRLPSLGELYGEVVIRTSIYTTLLAPLFYYLVRFIHRRFRKALAPYTKD